MKRLYITIIIIIILNAFGFAQDTKWGGTVHSYINAAAVDHLPAGMAFFKDQQSYLSSHASDPDYDNSIPGEYHYIDIDYYKEFLQGTLPHDKDDLIALYGSYIVEDKGTIPWVIDEWLAILSSLMASGDWTNAWQVAAELGHWVADSHQPLHLTTNYNGYETGNVGIHSRYESKLFYTYLSSVPEVVGTGIYWENPLDSVFAYIDDIYPSVDSIMIADDLAKSADPSYGSLYYSTMWKELEDLSIDAIHAAILDLASIWTTAWVNAGHPYPSTFNPTTVYVPDNFASIQAAINLADDGDTILVAPGTYNENINFMGKDIMVASNYILTGDTSIISQTIIQATENESAVIFRSAENPAALLCGFTIIGKPFGGDGEGIYIRYASPTLQDLKISTVADTLLAKPAVYGGSGGGIYLEKSQSTLNNITLTHNAAMNGGGLYAFDSDLNITHINVCQNQALGGGYTFLALGGGMAFVTSRVSIRNSIIADNYSRGEMVDGLGLYSFDSDIELINVTITGNQCVETASEILGGAIYIADSSNIKIMNSILWDNFTPHEIYITNGQNIAEVAIAYSDIAGGLDNGIVVNTGLVFWLDGNIEADPQFADTASGDYHLQKGSPCLDAGIQDTVITYNQGQNWLYFPEMEYLDAKPDMGAFESSYPVTITENQVIVANFRLLQNYPNPFNPVTTFTYEIPMAMKVKFEVINMLGEQVASLVDKWQDAGHYSLEWNASKVSSGIYFYRIQAGGCELIRRCAVIK